MSGVRLTRCERALGGYLIAWSAASQLAWNGMLTKVKHLPYPDREYFPAERAWWISDAVAPGVWKLVENAPDCEDVRPRRPAARAAGVPAAVRAACAVLFVAPDAPLAVVQAAYRALAKTCHPDAGGATAGMQRLNAAYETARAWAERQQSGAA